MKTIFSAAVILSSLVVSAPAVANCYNVGSNYRYCNDVRTGNRYNTQRIGDNYSVTNGYNSHTGKRWNQSTQRVGNTTFTNGRSSNGQSWNTTTQRVGNMTIRSGYDSSGRRWSQTCTQYGCSSR